MKKKDRNLNVFSVSALDLFASAMGTFMLLAIILFPYYLKPNTAPARLQQQQTEINRLKRRAAAAEAAAKAAQEEADRAEAEAAKAKKEAEEAKKRAGGVMRITRGDRSVSFAVGCWRTDPFQHNAEAKPGISQYCFDKDGKGNLVFFRSAQNESCGAFATIRRENGVIRIDDSNSRCSVGGRDGGPWYADHLTCHAGAGGVVICEGQSQMRDRIDRWRVRLHRQ
jgi:hypothetical protein